jgi:hypothetical protein
MKKLSFVAFAIILFFVTSCGTQDPNKNVDEGKIVGEIYSSSEIGWTIEIPTGWTVTDKDKLEKNDEAGKKAIEKTADRKYDFSGLKHLISFKKDKFNIFQSTSETFKLAYQGEWEDNNVAVKELVYNTYLDQGIKCDTTVTTIESIDGLDFYTYSFIIYNPKKEIVLRQILYSRYFEGLDFGMVISYNNEKYRDEMLKAIRNSKFKK